MCDTAGRARYGRGSGIVEENDDNRGNLIGTATAAEPPAAAGQQPHPYDALTPDVVIAAVESTGRLSDARILALNSYENRVYQVGIDEGEPVIAKFYRPARWSDAQIAEEHRFSQQLYDLELPVVPPLVINADADIDTLASFEGFRFSLYRRQGGRAPELDNLEHLYQLGQYIGRIHAVGSDTVFEHRLSLSIEHWGQASREYLLANDFIPPDLSEAYASVSRDVLAVVAENDPADARYAQISLHGDCHPGNVLWRDDRPHFVDFDDAIVGPAIQDLWMLLSGSRDQRQLQLLEILEGYEEFCAFDLAQLSLIEPLRALRVLHYSAWLARRWSDPAFPLSFPWFNTERYWAEHILELRELLASLREPVLQLPTPH